MALQQAPHPHPPDPAPDGRRVPLVAVVVTHNRLAHLRITLDRLLASPASLLAAVVVVDNLSDDGTGPWLGAQADPRLVVLHPDRNLGGAGGFEAGMRLAMERFDPDWLVVMDDDARPDPGALAAFAAMDRTGWEALAAAVHYPDGRICAMNRPWQNPFRQPLRRLAGRLTGRGLAHMGRADYAPGAAVRAVDGASFVGLFLSRAAIARAGYPDGRLFLYADDGLYTLGLTQAGGPLGFAPALRFEHDCSTFSGAPGRFTPLWKAYYYYRNMLMFHRRCAGPWFWPALLVLVPKWLMKARRHPGQGRAFLRLLGLALADGLARRTSRPHDQVLAHAGAQAIAPPRVP